MKSLKLVTILFAFILIASCKDDSPTDGGDASGLAAAIKDSEGMTGTYTKLDGTSGNVSGAKVLGWDSGQLLNSNFFRQLRLGTDIGTFNVRYNLEKGSDFTEIATETNSFSPYIMLLQDTQYISEYNIEGYFTSGAEFEQMSPFSGTIKLFKDKSYGGKSYNISGEIDAILSGTGRKFKLYFWKEVGNWQ